MSVLCVIFNALTLLVGSPACEHILFIPKGSLPWKVEEKIWGVTGWVRFTWKWLRVLCQPKLWLLYGIGQTIIFLPCGFFFCLSFFPHLISAVADWISAILPHMVWPWCEFKMQVWNVLHAARWKYRTQKKSPKIAIWAPLHNFFGIYLRN